MHQWLWRGGGGGRELKGHANIHLTVSIPTLIVVFFIHNLSVAIVKKCKTKIGSYIGGAMVAPLLIGELKQEKRGGGGGEGIGSVYMCHFTY